MVKKKQEYHENEVSIGKMISNTKENMEEAEISMEFAASPEEKDNLEEKNSRRRYAIRQMQEQMHEEKLARRREKASDK